MTRKLLQAHDRDILVSRSALLKDTYISTQRIQILPYPNISKGFAA